MSESRYSVLFEPVQIGPVTAPNRFYQVPHCTGMGHRMPQSLAAMRRTKAEGGWGVVCTEYCSIHPSSDSLPHCSSSLWDETDVRAQSLMTEEVHRFGALAGVELWHGGAGYGNLMSRETAMGARSRPSIWLDPTQGRAMDKRDLRDMRRWHVEAAERAKRAGFDIIYLYATHGYIFHEFLSPLNKRSDEYGGSLENRVRLLRETMQSVKEAVGDQCGIALRLVADSGGPDGEPNTTEQREVVEMLNGLPDIWDISVHDYSYEMGSSRFVKEGSLEGYVNYVKTITDQPVVGVGRFTSPDTMLRQVKQGVLDMIGCARPSIADPFLPNKIKEGRLEDIRECIGCNICYASDMRGIPIRCTQNPAMGEEWRRGWHPERIPAAASEKSVLVVGGGPAGLEAAQALGKRGYSVTLAEKSRALGGRAVSEATLPGLAEWSRVAEWREAQINKCDNVEVFLESDLDAEQILAFGADRVALATGCQWRRDGVGRTHAEPIEGWDTASVLTPEDLIAGSLPDGPYLVFDDDHYYMGGVLAEKLAAAGREVTLVTPGYLASLWTVNTAEVSRIQARLIDAGVRTELNTSLSGLDRNEAVLSCVFSGRERRTEIANVVMVTSRISNDALYYELEEQIDIARIGDCLAPGTIAACVHSGHRYAREMDVDDPPIFRRETLIPD